MKTSKELKQFSREMKKNPTKYEKLFAEKLKSAGIEFKEQVILGFYIADFILPKQMLCIEIDGKHHKTTMEYDRRRDAFIARSGFRVWRYENEKVDNIDIAFIARMQQHDLKEFRSAIARANAIKGGIISKTLKNKKVKARKKDKEQIQRSIGLDKSTWKALRKAKNKSCLTWNKFIKTLLTPNKL